MSAASEHRLDRLVVRLFRHRHQWHEYRLIGNKGRTVFYCRKCQCGADQIQNAGPMGDGRWQNRSQPLAHEFEREWLANAVPHNAELCGGPSGPSERAPGYASAPKTEE